MREAFENAYRKVAKNVYKVDSLCKYDAVVCTRAGLVGVEEFGNIKHFFFFFKEFFLSWAKYSLANGHFSCSPAT